jgi:hypothetical protein
MPANSGNAFTAAQLGDALSQELSPKFRNQTGSVSGVKTSHLSFVMSAAMSGIRRT